MAERKRAVKMVFAEIMSNESMCVGRYEVEVGQKESCSGRKVEDERRAAGRVEWLKEARQAKKDVDRTRSSGL
jgi:hypothetical protein